MRELARDSRTYELMVIISPDVADEDLGPAVDRVSGYIGDAGGSVQEILNDSPWGRRRLAYPIRHGGRDLRDGFYAVYHFTLAPDNVREIEREIKLNDQIMRYLVVQYKQPVIPEPRPEAATAESAEATPAETVESAEAAPEATPAAATEPAAAPETAASEPVIAEEAPPEPGPATVAEASAEPEVVAEVPAEPVAAPAEEETAARVPAAEPETAPEAAAGDEATATTAANEQEAASNAEESAKED